ncbi:hypothetical protein [Exiguobacterium qingdaonense]|uniref:hypothetical protein n=1 Tax=Exiguobacterium qingdaonense TaxID=2751251 RepID=UPI001BEACA53|nr:hypothetical protein [Exiguobacterium qingdaonense]
MKKMKVGELRKELKSFTQEELIELVVSLYKQHAEVKTTLNRYFIEEFEGDVMNELIRDIIRLSESASRGSNNLTLLKNGAAIVKKADYFKEPAFSEGVRVFYLNYFSPYVEEMGDLLEVSAPKELEIFFGEFDKVLKRMKEDPYTLYLIKGRVDDLLDEFPIHQREQIVAFWERQKAWVKENID